MKRILISGPIFDTPAGPSGQGGKLYGKLRQEGYMVYKRSKFRNPLFRVIDTLFFVIFHSGKYDIILIQMFSNKAFVIDYLVTNIALVLNKKTIPVIRGGAFVEFYNHYPTWVKSVLLKSGIITSPSHFIGNFLNSQGLTVVNVPNFIETEKFPYKWTYNDGKRLLWVRAYNDIYKPELAIRSLSKLKTYYPNITLTMIGPDQGKLSYCKELINELGLTESIEIVGPVSNDQLNTYYSSHNIYINTTSYESFGVALVEAACSGIPIVSTSVGEIPYMWVDNEDILLVKDQDEDDFVSRIKLLLDDTALPMKLSKNARIKAEKYSWENVRKQWNLLLEAV